MYINKKNLENYRKRAYARLGIALYLEELTKNLSSSSTKQVEEVEIANNLVAIPLDYEDDLIREIFNEVSGQQPFLIVPSSQKQCYFDSTCKKEGKNEE